VQGALDLATLRGLAAPARRELIEAITTVLAQGELLGRGRAAAGALEQVLIGQRSGKTAPGTLVSDLRENILTEVEALKLPLGQERQLSVEPLRNTLDLQRHVLLMRLLIGGITYATPIGQSLWRGAEPVGVSWRFCWSAATDASIELAASRSLTARQIAETVLLTRQAGNPGEAAALLKEAAACGTQTAAERAFQVAAPLASRVGLGGAVDLPVTLSDVASARIPGASLLPPTQRVRAAGLCNEFTAAAVRELHGILGSDDPADARTLATFAAQGSSHALGQGHALRQLARNGSPLMQGAAPGLL
jgi:hypothetical protein